MPTYTYRRELSREDWMKALGAGVGAGIGAALLATYAARIFLQRTPLRPEAAAPPVPRRPLP